MYLIDTNIFLEILLEQDNADKCTEFFENAAKQQTTCLVTSYTLHSIETILSNLKRFPVLIAFLEDLLDNQWIRHYHTTPEEELLVIRSMSEIGLDFDDALQYHIAKKFNATIVTYDRHFKKISDLNIVAP